MAELFISQVGFMVLEFYFFFEVFYMMVIIIFIVGFIEVQLFSLVGCFFIFGLIIINIGIFVYVLVVFFYYVIQGEIFKNMYFNFISVFIDKLFGYVIFCGYGKYGCEIVLYFYKYDVDFVVIENDLYKIEEL